ncbi:MAG: hypothetical protein FWE45_04875 [Firmicutes bacterium]|nr:hypothetical protein [Bacillota bacterium]
MDEEFGHYDFSEDHLEDEEMDYEYGGEEDYAGIADYSVTDEYENIARFNNKGWEGDELIQTKKDREDIKDKSGRKVGTRAVTHVRVNFRYLMYWWPIWMKTIRLKPDCIKLNKKALGILYKSTAGYLKFIALFKPKLVYNTIQGTIDLLGHPLLAAVPLSDKLGDILVNHPLIRADLEIIDKKYKALLTPYQMAKNKVNEWTGGEGGAAAGA